MKKSILITGGAGFIGSNLYNKLFSTGEYYIDVVDNLVSGKYSNIETIDYDENFYYLSFDDRHVLENIKQKKYNYVFHLAALPSVPYSIENPYESFNVNVNKTIKLLDACRGNIDKFIFASSCAVYGGMFDDYWPQGIPETSQCLVVSPYAQQKLDIENYLTMFERLYNLNQVSFRFFNVYGPKQFAGNAYANVISSWLYNIKHNMSLRLDGDGTQTRDFVYVDDIVNVLIKSIEKDFSCQSSPKCYNLGTGNSISCNDVLQTLKQKFPNITIENAPVRSGDIKNTKANMDYFYSSFGEYRFTNFNDGLEKTIKWWQDGCN